MGFLPPLANRLITCWHLTEIQHLLCFPPCDCSKCPFSPIPPFQIWLPSHTCRQLDTAANLLATPLLPACSAFQTYWLSLSLLHGTEGQRRGSLS